jgi:hypothetical protein
MLLVVIDGTNIHEKFKYPTIQERRLSQAAFLSLCFFQAQVFRHSQNSSDFS